MRSYPRPLRLAALSLLIAASASAQTKPPTTVVLVHGAFADGSSWDKVIPTLQAKGLNVVAVQNPLTSLADDVAATRRAIDAAPGPVVLVGHSWGGTVITEAGADEKVAALVYIAAFVPSEGQSVAELGKDYPPPPGAAHIKADAGGYLRLTPEGVAQDFAQDLPAAQATIMAATQGPVAAKAFDERPSAAAWKHKPSFYIVAARDRMIQPALEQAMAKQANATTTTLQTSHVAMLSRPREVAAVILTAVNSVK